MKKPVLFTILLIVSTTAFSKAIIPEIPTSDIDGAEDHPLLKRYADSYIVAHQHKSYDEFTFPTSKLATKKDSVGILLGYSIDQSKTVEGPYTRLVYLLPENRSPLEILRNYQDEIIAQGGSVLFECKREECGGDPGKGIRKSNNKPSLATVLRPREGIGSIKAILPEAQMYWNALFVNMLPDQQRVVAPFAQ